MTKDELERQAAALVEANPAHICALCIPLGEEPLFDLGGKTRVVSASTIKTPISAPPWSRCGKENFPWTSR